MSHIEIDRARIETTTEFLLRCGSGTVIQEAKNFDRESRDEPKFSYIVGQGRGPRSIRSKQDIRLMLEHADQYHHCLYFRPWSARIGMVWADIDSGVRADDPQWDSPPPGIRHPTWVINTGGGQQLLWQLKDKLNESSEFRHSGVIDGLALALEGDRAVNNGLKQLLRLPGSINFPKPAKRAQGRGPTVVTVARRPGDETPCWSLADFPIGTPRQRKSDEQKRQDKEVGEKRLEAVRVQLEKGEIPRFRVKGCSTMKRLAAFPEADDKSIEAGRIIWGAMAAFGSAEAVRVWALAGEAGHCGQGALTAYILSKHSGWLDSQIARVIGGRPKLAGRV